MSDKLSRKEIKRDEVMETMNRGVLFVRDHARTLILAAVAMVAVILVVLGVAFYLDSREASASEALSAAIEVSEAEINPDGPAPDADNPVFADADQRRDRAEALFREVYEDYGSTEAGAVAASYLGRYAAEKGDAEAAREYWQAALEKSEDDALGAQVQLNLVNLDLAAGNREAVLERLEEMLAAPSSVMPEDMVLFKIAEVREEMGRSEEALAAYRRIVDEFPASPYVQPARQKTTTLGGEPG